MNLFSRKIFSVFLLCLAAIVCLGFCAVSYGEKETKAVPATKHAYVGATKCRMCHVPYFNAWSETGHARAFSALSTEKKEDKDPKCLACHTTGLGNGGYDAAKTAPDLKGVQCEACHGPGADYMKTMTDSTKAVGAGLVFPVPESVCVGCHNKKSPKFNGFDFKKYLARGVHTIKKETKQ